MASIFNEKINVAKFSNQKEYLEEALNYYITDGKNFYKERTSPILSIISKVNSIPDLPTMQEGVKVKIDPIPFNLLLQIRMFFKKVYQEYKTESSAFILRDNKTKQYEIFIPEQKNSGATSDYEMGSSERYEKTIKNGKELIMVAHSHPWKSSSTGPSGTDNNDEKEPIIYMILSNVEEIPVYYLSTCDGNNRVKIDFFDVWENPLLECYNNIPEKIRSLVEKNISVQDVLEAYVEDVEIPYDEWKSFIKKDIFENKYYNSRLVNSFDEGSRDFDWYHKIWGNKNKPKTPQNHILHNGTKVTTYSSNKKNEIEEEKNEILKGSNPIEEMYAFVMEHIEERYKYDLESGRMTINEMQEHYDRLKLKNDSNLSVLAEEIESIYDVLDNNDYDEIEGTMLENTLSDENESLIETIVTALEKEVDRIDEIKDKTISKIEKRNFLKTYREFYVPFGSTANIKLDSQLFEVPYDKLSDKMIEYLYSEKSSDIQYFVDEDEYDSLFELSVMEQVIVICNDINFEKIKSKHPEEGVLMSALMLEKGIDDTEYYSEKVKEVLVNVDLDGILTNECTPNISEN